MQTTISIIPEPVKWDLKDGQFRLSAQIPVVAEGPAMEVAAWFVRSISPATGFEPELCSSIPAGSPGAICFRLDPGLERLGAEGYRFSAAPQQVDLSAPEPAGLFYAAQTLRQLLPPQVFCPAPVDGVEWTIPAVEIEDYPRFSWRGAMLDVGRHFMPKTFVLKFIDLLALHKFNTFHWHLTEDQGWRIEIKKYPRLTEVGAWRKGTVVGHADELSPNPVYDGVPHGGFYTQDEVREVVEYARQRFVRVVPEIEMPGHCIAAIAAYPELGNTGEKLGVTGLWGIHDHVFNVEESTILFLQDVLGEVLELFPGEFIHIGGDEVPKTEWQNSAPAQERMRQLGLKNEDQLQSYFIRRMDEYLSSHGRRLVGWDEILEGGLAPGATVMSWRGEAGGIAAANAGHDVVMAPHQYLYLNNPQTEEEGRKFQGWGGFMPLSHVYPYDPVPAEILPEKAQHVLGAQAEFWSEYIQDGAMVEYMGYPRLCAVAEIDWSPLGKKDYNAFTGRLHTHLKRLDGIGVNYCKNIE